MQFAPSILFLMTYFGCFIFRFARYALVPCRGRSKELTAVSSSVRLEKWIIMKEKFFVFLYQNCRCPNLKCIWWTYDTKCNVANYFSNKWYIVLTEGRSCSVSLTQKCLGNELQLLPHTLFTNNRLPLIDNGTQLTHTIPRYDWMYFHISGLSNLDLIYEKYEK